MKYALIFLPVLIAATSVSCTKNAEEVFTGNTDTTNTGTMDTTNTGNTDTTGINDTSLVKTLTIAYESGSRDVYTFYYNAQKRITEVKSDHLNIDFEYSNDLITKNIYPNGQQVRNNYYYFNGDSVLDSAFLTLDSITITHVYYQYNPANEIAQRKEYSINYDGDTITKYVYKYEYDNKENPIWIGAYFIESSDSILVYADKFIYSDSADIVTSADRMYPDYMRSKNLLRLDYHDSPYMPGLSHFDTYRYEFDHSNRLKTVFIQSDHDYFSYTKNYTYY